jgi:hypothetical protein
MAAQGSPGLMTDDQIRQIAIEIVKAERAATARVLGLPFSWQAVIALLGVIAFIGSAITGYIGMRDDIKDAHVLAGQNARALENLSQGFKTLGDLTSTLNSDNTLQRYQIEEAQKNIEALKRESEQRRQEKQ